MDMTDGYMTQNIPPGVEYINYNQPGNLPENSIVIMQSCPLWIIPKIEEFPPTAKIIYWNLHPDNLNPNIIQHYSNNWLMKNISMHIFTGRLTKLKKLITMMNQKSAIYFMDFENMSKTLSRNKLSDINAKYLPICTDDSTYVGHLPIPVGETINCVWIGRIEDFKTSILEHTIKRLSTINKFVINFDIIGDGTDKPYIEKTCHNVPSVRTRLLDPISIHDIDQTLARYHVVFAMGTSALEGAKIGLPTILLDYSYEKIVDLYRFRMIYDSQNYNVGEEITRDHFEVESSLEELMERIYMEYDSESSKCKEYWNKNHSPNRVVKELEKYIEESSCTFGGLREAGLHKPDILTLLKGMLRQHDNSKTVWVNS